MTEYRTKRGPDSNITASPIVWVLASGPVIDPISMTEMMRRPDVVIVADGGSSLAARLNLVPDLIVGDLDSSKPKLIADFEARGVEIRRYEHHTKAETDTELAVFAALELDPGEIVLIGTLGGRIDHALANILLLTNPRLEDVTVRIVGEEEELFLARPGTPTEVPGQVGDTVSLLPIMGTARGVILEGFEYPLQDEPLYQGFARGVSNRLARTVGSITIESGTLLVVLTHDKADTP